MTIPYAWTLGGLGAGMVVVALSAFNPQSAAQPAGMRLAAAAFDGPVDAQVVRVIDGDTFEAAATIWLNQTIDVHVRIAGIDAPELHGHCAQERTNAQAARQYLDARIGGGTVSLSDVRYDKYGGRVRAVVRDEQGDVGRAMIDSGHARPYHGGHRQPWCAAT